jgi:hypothetical protein
VKGTNRCYLLKRFVAFEAQPAASLSSAYYPYFAASLSSAYYPYFAASLSLAYYPYFAASLSLAYYPYFAAPLSSAYHTLQQLNGIVDVPVGGLQVEVADL